MKILSLGYSKVNSGCFWIRVKTPFDQMKQEHEVYLSDGKKEYALDGWDIVSLSNIISETSKVENGEVVIITLPEMVESLKRKGVKIVYDTDDAQEIHPHKDDFGGIINGSLDNYYYILKHADLITCTTEHLKDHLRKFTGKPIAVLPNCINPELFRQRGREEKVKVIYAGSTSHIKDAELVIESLYNLRKKHGILFETMGFSLEHKDWKVKSKKGVLVEQYYDALAGMNADIGICPLKENEFNLNKSPLKFLEYVSVGTLALASNRYPYKGEMKDEWLVDDDKWEETLERYILDGDLREKTIREQRKWVLENRDIRKEWKRWESAYQSILEKPKPEDMTVVVPVWGEYEKYIPECLETLDAQSVQGFEVLVDQTPNLPEARNNMIRKAHGKYILPLDVDDRLHGKYIENVLEKLYTYDIVTTDHAEFGDGNAVSDWPEQVTLEDIEKGMKPIACSAFRKDLWEKVGGYDESFSDGFEDWDFWLRCAKAGADMYRIKKVLYFYRKHGKGMSETQDYEKLTKKLKAKHNL